MRKITLESFLDFFTNNRSNKRFCFILGSGASVNSGIPSGGTLAKDWIIELKELWKADPDAYKQWLIEENVDEENPAPHYSKIFDKRFELGRSDGFAFLQDIMEKAEPSFGYSVLAHVLANTKHNVVITTNFDSLTEDALFIYTSRKPLIVGHESLASFISADAGRPMVVKIHRDMMLSPKNGASETIKLADGFRDNLGEIFKRYIPVVIGYGGNDGSLMDFLEGLDCIQKKLFWFYWKKEPAIPDRIEGLLKKQDGFLVPMDGFDELMIKIFNSDPLFVRLDARIEEVARQRADSYRHQMEELMKDPEIGKVARDALDTIWKMSKEQALYLQQLRAKESGDSSFRGIFIGKKG